MQIKLAATFGEWKKNEIRLFRLLVESCFTHGVEVWTIREEMKRRINVFVVEFWRRCCGITYLTKIKNKDGIEKRQII